MRIIITVITLLFFGALAVGFSNMNAGQIVSLKFLGLRMEDEFSYFMFIALLVGLTFGFLLMSWSVLKYRMRARQANKKLLKLEKELVSLKATTTIVES